MCHLIFRPDDLLETDHIIPKSQGGSNEYKNLQLLHRHCHVKKTRLDLEKYKELKILKSLEKATILE